VSARRRRARAGHSHLDIYVDVFAESLYRVGKLWEQNTISVAQEHIATSITQYAIAAIYPRLVPVSIQRGRMIVTGVSGELHQIGANLVADAMESNGWTVRFLGTNLPHSAVLATVEEFSPEVLCISTTIVANLASVVELTTPIAIRDRAIVLLTFASGRRRAEIAGLNVEDLDFGRPGFLIVTIRKSKTDQGGAGQFVAVPRIDNGPCAVAAVEAWLSIREQKKGAAA
jgi:cobalamin-dependent methionine synthase I